MLSAISPLHTIHLKLALEAVLEPCTKTSGPKAGAPIPQTRPTGQKRSLERGKSTRKKSPGKRAHKWG